MTLTTLVVLALAFLLTVYLRRRTARPPAETTSNTKILVCSLGWTTAENFEDADAKVYSTYYQRVDVAKGQQVDDFLSSINENGYDVIHLFCQLNEDGDLLGEQGLVLKANTFLAACRRADVKLLFIASPNLNEGYVNMGRQQPKNVALHVIRTIGRNEDNFTFFLGELLRRMSAGKTLPQACVEVAPQVERLGQHQKLPAVYCSVDRAAVLLP